MHHKSGRNRDRRTLSPGLDTLRNHCDAAGLPYTEDDGDLLLAGHIGSDSRSASRDSRGKATTLAPLDVQMHLDGDTGDRFRVGTLGVGGDRPSAMRSAIEEWHLLAASPVLAALGATWIGARAAQATFLAAATFRRSCWYSRTLPPGMNPSGIFYRQLLDVSPAYRGVDTGRHPQLQLRSIFVMASIAEDNRKCKRRWKGSCSNRW